MYVHIRCIFFSAYAHGYMHTCVRMSFLLFCWRHVSSAQAGGAYVMSGQSNGGFSAEYSLADSPDIDGVTTFLGLAAEDSLGLAVGSAGDLNGDGLGDLWVRSPKTNGRPLLCLLETTRVPEIHISAKSSSYE